MCLTERLPLQLDDFGQALNNICSIVTKGVVCFCPSYALLDTLVKRWSESGIWARLCQKKKVRRSLVSSTSTA